MGVDYSAVSGYGFVLTDEDDFEEFASQVGYVNRYPDEGFDRYEFIEWLTGKYSVDFAIAGDAYSGNIYYLIGDTISTSVYGLEEAGNPLEIKAPVELTNKLVELLKALGLERKIGYYTGLYIH